MKRATQDDYSKVTTTEIRKHVLTQYPQEMCGVVADGSFYPLNNVADYPKETFKVDPVEWLVTIKDKQPEFFIHSHCYDPSIPKKHKMHPATPSQRDFEVQKEMDIPWAIFATEGENVTTPVLFPLTQDLELIGREFIFYSMDCYTLFSDYYYQQFGIELGHHPENIQWEKGVTDNIYETSAPSYGFIEVPIENVRYGDLIFMSIQGLKNHGGVMDKDGMIIHHLSGRLSERLPFHKLKSFITGVWRHKTRC